MRGVAVGLTLAAIIVACVHPPPPKGIEKRQEILSRWMEIRQWRHERGWDVDPPNQLMQYARGRSVSDLKNVCPDGMRTPRTCGDVCTLSDDICTNADEICRLADELGKDDTFAQEKCTSAKASCRESQQRCCDCKKNPPAPPGGAP